MFAFKEKGLSELEKRVIVGEGRVRDGFLRIIIIIIKQSRTGRSECATVKAAGA